MKTDIMGVGYDNVTMDQAIALGEALLGGDTAAMVVTPNAEIAYEAMHDEDFRSLLNSAQLVLPDGAGVVLGAKLIKTPLKQKVAGIDWAAGMLQVFARRGTGLYLLGGKPGIAQLAAEKMRQQAPGLRIVGMADGYFKDEGPVIAAINDSGAQALFVCLGAPKQERFMAAHRQELTSVRLMAGLGGSLDGFAGTVKRAPGWMIRLNLEWFYRLLKEPRRLGRMMRLPKFILAALRWRKKGNHG